jgi:hypothetical protein
MGGGEYFDNVQGVLGFARQDQYNPYNPLYMEKIKSTNHVTTEQISFYLGAPGQTNYVDVGAVIPTGIKNANSGGVAWFNQE